MSKSKQSPMDISPKNTTSKSVPSVKMETIKQTPRSVPSVKMEDVKQTPRSIPSIKMETVKQTPNSVKRTPKVPRVKRTPNSPSRVSSVELGQFYIIVSSKATSWEKAFRLCHPDVVLRGRNRDALSSVITTISQELETKRKTGGFSNIVFLELVRNVFNEKNIKLTSL